MAVVNLGYTTYPQNITQMTAGQSFYIDLGNQSNVKSMLILLNVGALNATISTGSPGNWIEAINVTWSYSNGGWSEDYNKYVSANGQNEIPIGQTTQYLKIDIGTAGYDTNLLQIAVVNENNQIATIQSITNVGAGNPDVNNLINAQSSIHYPVTYLENTYFDEIYFVRTAEQYIHLQYPYEWTHPPLGKLIQAGGILIFGFTPFGWRVMGVIFATLMIPLIYFAGKKMCGTWIGGFTAAFMLTFDFMHFTMGRMGTADTYVVFFSLASQLFFLIYLKNVVDKGWKTSVIPLFLAIMFAALGISTKWLVLFGFVGALAILLVLRLSEVIKLKGKLSEKVYAFLDHPYSAIVCFLLLAVGVYFIVYIPDMLAGRSFLGVLNLQDQMYVYQSTLKATHPFSSPWFSWPLMFNPFNGGDNGGHVPLWLQYAGPFPNGKVSTITLLGNPALWWVGLAVILGFTFYYIPKLLLGKFDLKKNLPVIFILVYFFFQWLPYIIITRVVFIYHFYSCVPLLCLSVGFVVSKYWSSNYVKIAAIAYFAVTIALFVLFYPIISGVSTTTSTINSLTWFKGWILG
ncbi:MAG: glycosyltransferase family 39 protein [Candidatus Bathyarchaeia archaeon]|jgi:dolichyl-phosphate-mannose--protein O-mannosyl transferase